MLAIIFILMITMKIFGVTIMLKGHGDKPCFVCWSWWDCGDVQSPGLIVIMMMVIIKMIMMMIILMIMIILIAIFSSEESLHSRSYAGPCPGYKVAEKIIKDAGRQILNHNENDVADVLDRRVAMLVATLARVREERNTVCTINCTNCTNCNLYHHPFHQYFHPNIIIITFSPML